MTKDEFELVTATASLNQFQQPGRTSFELVTTSFNNNEKPVWASYSQFQQAVTTRKNQFELVTASFNDKEKPVWASYSQFQQLGKNVELITASFNDKEKPVWASYSQSKQPGRTGFR